MIPAILLAPEVLAAIGATGAIAGIVGYLKGNSDGKTEIIRVQKGNGGGGISLNLDIVLIAIALIAAGYYFIKKK